MGGLNTCNTDCRSGITAWGPCLKSGYSRDANSKALKGGGLEFMNIGAEIMTNNISQGSLL